MNDIPERDQNATLQVSKLINLVTKQNVRVSNDNTLSPVRQSLSITRVKPHSPNASAASINLDRTSNVSRQSIQPMMTVQQAEQQQQTEQANQPQPQNLMSYSKLERKSFIWYCYFLTYLLITIIMTICADWNVVFYKDNTNSLIDGLFNGFDSAFKYTSCNNLQYGLFTFYVVFCPVACIFSLVCYCRSKKKDLLNQYQFEKWSVCYLIDTSYHRSINWPLMLIEVLQLVWTIIELSTCYHTQYSFMNCAREFGYLYIMQSFLFIVLGILMITRLFIYLPFFILHHCIFGWMERKLRKTLQVGPGPDTVEIKFEVR